jgi:hypothetical protein
MTRLTPKQVGEVLAARQARSLEKERPQKAEVSGTGSGIANRGTTGQIRATLSNGTTIWVDAGGNLAELTAGDIIWVERIGVGTRSEWRMVDWFSDSVGNRVPAGRSDVFNAKVSEIWAADGDPIALDTDNSGNMQVLTSIDMDGKELILDEDGDTSIQADSDDVIDINVAGTEIGSITATGMTLIAGRDFGPQGDSAPLFYRSPNQWHLPDDHFNDFSGWTWENSDYDGTPSIVDVYTFPSLLRVGNSSASTAFFAYHSVSGAQTIHMRCSLGSFVEVGIRADDGSDDNYLHWLLAESATAGLMRLRMDVNTGGGGIATTYYADGLPPAFYLLTMGKSTGGGFCYYSKDGPVASYVTNDGPVTSWNPTRIGMFFRINGTVSDHVALVDWYEE